MEASRKVEDDVWGGSEESEVSSLWPFVVISSAWGFPVVRGSCWSSSCMEVSRCGCAVESVGSCGTVVSSGGWTGPPASIMSVSS